MDTLKEVEDLTTTILAASNLMLQSHTQDTEWWRAVAEEELEEHMEVDVEDVVKVK